MYRIGYVISGILIGIGFGVSLERKYNTNEIAYRPKVIEVTQNAYARGLIDGNKVYGTPEETIIELKKLNDEFIKDLEQKF